MKKSGLTTLATVLALSITVPLHAESSPRASEWEHIDEDEGIDLWKQDVPGQLVPSFRGQVVIAAEIGAVSHAIEDYRAHPQWMHRCAESGVIRQLNELDAIMYNRLDSPWPVADRDVVVKTHKQVSADGSEIELSFQNVKDPQKPEIDGVVRMPKLVGHYKLTRAGAKKTKVEYQVAANPGGSLPQWIIKRVARDMPYVTLAKLRERVTGR